MLNSPITGDEYLDTFLYDLRDAVVNINTDTQSTNETPETVAVVGYPYRYMYIRYADNNTGSGFSTSQTGKSFFGLYNVDTLTPSTNPVDYTWFEVAGGFMANTLWYRVSSSRQVSFTVSGVSPGNLYSTVPTTAIDLNLISAVADLSSRVAYTLSSSPLSSVPSFYTSTGSSSVPPINTWSANETWYPTAPLLVPGSTLFQIDGVFNSTTGVTTWYPPYLSTLRVGSISAISANLGSITSGDIYGAQIRGGAFQSYAWPATGAGGGFFLGPQGLRVGNLNDGQYFYADQNGNVGGPGFSISGGVLNITQVNVIDTPNLEVNSATTLVSANSAGAVVTVSMTLAYQADVLILGTGSSGQTLGCEIGYKLSGAPTYTIIQNQTVQAGSIVLSSTINLAAGSYDFVYSLGTGGGAATISVFASIR